MSEELDFYIPGKPVGKGRARSTKTGHHYTPAKTVQFESLVAYHAQQAMNGRPLYEGPMNLSLEIRFDVPKSWPQKKQVAALSGVIRPTKKPDCSNIIKAIEDALNQVVYVDDVQIVSGQFTKHYASQAGVRVILHPINLEGGSKCSEST